MNLHRTSARLLAAAALAVLAASAPAAAEDVFVAAGAIARANPASKSFAGITERTNPCGQPHPVLGDVGGLDGAWIALPEYGPGRPARLRTDALDADVWFYRMDAGACVLIDGGDGWNAMATDLTPNEDGIIPAEAAYAIVDVALGDGVAFTFAIG